MDRLQWLSAQPWLETDTASSSSSAHPLRTAEHSFASHEICEGIATFALITKDATTDDDDSAERIAFRASLLASRWETRIRLALQPEPPATGAKRRREEAGELPPSRLLVRFESAGRALQGRLLHTQIERLVENVSELPPPDTPVPPPFLKLYLPAGLEMTITPLPELSPASGAEQLRKVLGRMWATLPKAQPPPPQQQPVEQPEAAADAAPPAEPQAASSSTSCASRVAGWHAFLRDVSELAGELEEVATQGKAAAQAVAAAGGDAAAAIAAATTTPASPVAPKGKGLFGGGASPTRKGGGGGGGGGGLFGRAKRPSQLVRAAAAAATPGGGGSSRLSDLLTSLPTHLSHAMPASAAEGAATKAAAEAAVRGAEAAYSQQALRLLQGSAATGAAAAAASSEAEAESVEASAQRSREQLKKAYAARLSALLLPGRSE